MADSFDQLRRWLAEPDEPLRSFGNISIGAEESDGGVQSPAGRRVAPGRELSKNFVSTDRGLGGAKNGSNVLDRLEGGVGPVVREFEPGRARTHGHGPIHPVGGYMPSLPVVNLRGRGGSTVVAAALERARPRRCQGSKGSSNPCRKLDESTQFHVGKRMSRCRGGEPQESSNPQQSESHPSTELPQGLPRYPGAPIDHDDPEHVANDGVENPNLGGRVEPPNSAGLRDLLDQDPWMRSKGSGSQKI
jgi:hypothetical protein